MNIYSYDEIELYKNYYKIFENNIIITLNTLNLKLINIYKLLNYVKGLKSSIIINIFGNMNLDYIKIINILKNNKLILYFITCQNISIIINELKSKYILQTEYILCKSINNIYYISYKIIINKQKEKKIESTKSTDNFNIKNIIIKNECFKLINITINTIEELKLIKNHINIYSENWIFNIELNDYRNFLNKDFQILLNELLEYDTKIQINNRKLKLKGLKSILCQIKQPNEIKQQTCYFILIWKKKYF